MLAVHDRLTVCVCAATPVPLTPSCVVVGDPLLVNVIVPLAAAAEVGVKVTVNPALCPDGIVTGRVRPVTLNCELLELTAETVTLAVLAFRLAEAVPLDPTVTLPSASVVGLTASTPVAVVPVPVSPTVSVGFDAFELTVSVPLALAAAVGVKVTLNVWLFPAASVTGVVMPLTLNPVLANTAEIVTLSPPVFVTVCERVWLFPTCTLPKPRLVGFAVSVPGETPVPEREIVSVAFDAFDVTVTLPLTPVAVAGSKLTLNVALCPDVSVTGVVIPLTE